MEAGSRGLQGRIMMLSATLALAGGATLCSATSAGALGFTDFCPPGEGAGQCGVAAGLGGLRGLSFDAETGRLYVADRTNNRVDVFTEDGKFVEAFGWGVKTGAGELETCGPAVPEAAPNPALCKKGISTASAGGFNGPTRVAVDNVAASPSHHDVYVIDEGNHRIEKFQRGATKWELLWAKGSAGEAEGQLKTRPAIGVGPAGTVYVLDNLSVGGTRFKQRLQRLDPTTGEPLPTQCILGERGQALDLAVAADGSFWVATEQEGQGVRKYNPPPPPGGCVEQLFTDGDVAESNALAIDEAGRLLIEQREERAQGGGDFHVLMARDAAGGPIARFGYGALPPEQPEGFTVRSGGEAGAFVSFGESFTAGIRRILPELPPPGPIVAPPSLEMKKIGGAKATAAVEVNPEGKPTEIHVEYLTQADFVAQGNSFAGPATEETEPEDLGAEGFRLALKEFPIGCPNPTTETADCLEPDTEYRFRVVAESTTGEQGEGTLEGPPFTTRPSPEVGDIYSTDVGTDTARLVGEVDPWGHDATAYFEYVDDADFQAGGFAAATKVPDVGAGQDPLDFGAGEEALVSRAITLYPLAPGTTYHYRMVVSGAQGTTTTAAEALRTFQAPRPTACANDASRIGAGALLPDCRAYELVSPLDKEGGDIRVLTDEFDQLTVLEQASESGEELAYGSARSFGGAASAPYTSQYIARRVAGQEWESHSIDVARGKPVVGEQAQIHSEIKALSADLCQAWIGTYAEMPEAPSGFQPGTGNLLLRRDRLCGEEGLEALAPRKAVTGLLAPTLRGTSADGTHAIFTTNTKLSAEGKEGVEQLYESVGGAVPRFVCRLPNGTPFNGACTAGTLSSTGLVRPLGGAISADGQRIFFSTGGAGAQALYVRIAGTQTVAVSGGAAATFWGAAADGSVAVFTSGGTLHSFDVDGKADSTIAAGVVGVLGMSGDAKRIYFASTQKLVGSGANSEGDEALEGQPNLYLHGAGGGTEFVATLAGADLEALGGGSEEYYGVRAGQVTPDGAHVLFRSVAPLTGYDNRQAATNCGSLEVGGARCREVYRYEAGTGTLLCVSCNPSGARPPGPSTIPFFESPLHAARVLSDDGTRAYFQSADRLAARDSNGKVDVYQWEQAGAGGCSEGSYDYSAQDGGCVELVSSGQGTQDSRFVESDPSGRNVFFATVSSLLPQDYGLFDIYDARVDGGLPIPPPPVPPCEGDECHHPATPPAPPSPAGSAYVPPQAKKAACPRGRHKVGAKGKKRCVAKRHKRHHRRAAR
jgi:hypothetical protein